jgi:hypothetical protein
VGIRQWSPDDKYSLQLLESATSGLESIRVLDHLWICELGLDLGVLDFKGPYLLQHRPKASDTSVLDPDDNRSGGPTSSETNHQGRNPKASDHSLDWRHNISNRQTHDHTVRRLAQDQFGSRRDKARIDPHRAHHEDTAAVGPSTDSRRWRGIT